MTTLKEISFIDLYLGSDYAEIKGLAGASAYLIDLPSEYVDDAIVLKNECVSYLHKTGKTEFSLVYDGRLYRMTASSNVFGGENFVIRQTPANIIPFTDIPFTSIIRRSVELTGATGLFLIAGEMGSGKTTTASSVLQHRILTTSNLGVSIEDPIETLLQGRHGHGRCLQLEVGDNETYATATKKAWRMGATSFLLGEIRDGLTAHEVLKASLSMFVVSTIHASSITEAIERYIMFCEDINNSSKTIVANTLFVVAHQTMMLTKRGDVFAGRAIDINAYNLKNCQQAHAIRTKIAQGNYQALSDEFSGIKYTL